MIQTHCSPCPYSAPYSISSDFQMQEYRTRWHCIRHPECITVAFYEAIKILGNRFLLMPTFETVKPRGPWSEEAHMSSLHIKEEPVWVCMRWEMDGRCSERLCCRAALLFSALVNRSLLMLLLQCNNSNCINCLRHLLKGKCLRPKLRSPAPSRRC